MATRYGQFLIVSAVLLASSSEPSIKVMMH